MYFLTLIIAQWYGIFHLSKIESLQKRALRFLLVDNENSYEQLLSETGRYYMSVYRLQAVFIQIFTIINNLTPEYIKDIFQVTHKTRFVRKQQQKYLAKHTIHTSTFAIKV